MLRCFGYQLAMSIAACDDDTASSPRVAGSCGWYSGIEAWTDSAATFFADAPVPPDVVIAVSAMLRRASWFVLHHRRPTHNDDSGEEVAAFVVAHCSGRFVLDFENANGWLTVAHAADPSKTFTWWSFLQLKCEPNERKPDKDGVIRGRHDTALPLLGNHFGADKGYRSLHDVVMPPFLERREYTDEATGEAVVELTLRDCPTSPLRLFPNRVRRVETSSGRTRELRCDETNIDRFVADVDASAMEE